MSLRAAQYLRMSTDRQEASPEIQAAAIAAHALERGYSIVRTFRDDGVSGLTLKRRKGLQALLAEVVGGGADFEVVLVYDVSRWGRFQNPDQSAHYEYICSEAGVRVEYCAELFENDGSLGATLLKSLKRAMAAEYSRELSVKVATAKRRWAAKGFWCGGPAGYGYSRLMLDREGRPQQVLGAGERKAISNHRIVIAKGPADEIAVVRRIFHAFVEGGQTVTSIAAFLNAEAVPGPGGGRWRPQTVCAILRNAKYGGDLAYTTDPPRPGLRRRRKSGEWVVVRDAAPALVSRRTFARAQALIAARRPLDDEVLLGHLRRLHAAHGHVSFRTLREDPDAPGDWVYRRRWGALRDAFAAAGLPRQFACDNTRRWPDKAAALDALARLLAREGRLSGAIIARDAETPGVDTYQRLCGSLGAAYALVGYAPAPGGVQAAKIDGARKAAADTRRPRLGLSPGPPRGGQI